MRFRLLPAARRFVLARWTYLRRLPSVARSLPAARWRELGLRWLGVIVVTVVGSAVGAALAPATVSTVGPLQLQLRVVPSVTPGVQILLPPAGQVSFHTHLSPVAVQVAISEVDPDGARRLIDSPQQLQALERSAPDDLRRAAARAALTTAGCALAGAVLLALVVYRRDLRRTVQVAVMLVGVLGATGLATAATFQADRLAQPQFSGLLSKAPYVAGQVSSLVDRLRTYQAGVADLIQGVTTLYATSGDLPVLPAQGADLVTVLHVSDIHLNPLAFDLIDRLVTQFGVDVVVDTGDITTWGTQVESDTLSRIRGVKAPYVFVRGNHDSRLTQAAVAAAPNAIVLDGDVREVAGLVIAGIGDPVFTPDTAESQQQQLQPRNPSGPTPSAVPSVPAPSTPPGGTATSGGPTTTSGATSTATGSATTSTATTSTVTGVTPQGENILPADPELRAGTRLADLIRQWDLDHPAQQVEIAAVHEPYATPPLLGSVPLVLAGHLHRRLVTVDRTTGTRVMVEGSTGGAGVTYGAMQAVDKGKPVPLTATLLYLARSGPRSGQLVGYDEVTVGGYGLVSVTLQRTVVRQSAVKSAPPGEQGGGGVTGTAGAGGNPPGSLPSTPPSTPPATPAAQRSGRSRAGRRRRREPGGRRGAGPPVGRP